MIIYFACTSYIFDVHQDLLDVHLDILCVHPVLLDVHMDVFLVNTLLMDVYLLIFINLTYLKHDPSQVTSQLQILCFLETSAT